MRKKEITTTHMRLNQAAEILGADSDTLLIAATEGRIRLYGLLNVGIFAEKGTFEECDDGAPLWIQNDSGFIHFMFVPISRNHAGEVLTLGRCDVSRCRLSNDDQHGKHWRDTDPFSRQPEELVIFREGVFAKREDVDIFSFMRNVTEAKQDAQPASADEFRAHASPNLTILNKAFSKFWANADRDDKGTHPDNEDVAVWLIEKSYSPTTANIAASIIRPAWAAKGRKPRNE
jgi:hypothetical protein